MKSILLVDDNEDIRELYGAILRDAGYEVQEAENGADALSVLQQHRPALVVLDLMMPVMSGPEFLNVLHGSQSLASLPVIVVTAGGRLADAPRAQRFIRKPVDRDALLAAVREFCGDAVCT